MNTEISIDQLIERQCGALLAVMKVSAENVKESVDSFREIIKKGNSEIKNLVKEILNMITLQSENADALTEVIFEICKSIPEKETKNGEEKKVTADPLTPEDTFKKTIFQMCFKTATTFRTKIPHFYFLKKLMKKGVFTIAEIGNKIAKFPANQANQFFTLFLFFAQELFSKRKTTYNNTMEKFSSFKSLDPSLQAISSMYEELTKDNFSRLNHITEYGSDVVSIETALRTNNVDQLKIFSEKSDFNLAKQMSKIPFEIHEALQEKPFYIEYAAFYGSISCIKLLLSLGGEIKQAGMYAVAGGNLECIKFCLDNGAPTNKMLIAAHKAHRFDLIGKLCEMIGEKSKELLEQSFFVCVRSNNLIGCAYCINHGISANAKDVADCNAAIYAASVGNLEILKSMVELGCDPIADDITGWSALHFAAKYGYTDIVQYLLSLPKVDVNSKTGTGLTALHIACEAENVAVIQYLLSFNGINKSCIDAKGHTALSLVTSAEVRKSIESLF